MGKLPFNSLSSTTNRNTCTGRNSCSSSNNANSNEIASMRNIYIYMYIINHMRSNHTSKSTDNNNSNRACVLLKQTDLSNSASDVGRGFQAREMTCCHWQHITTRSQTSFACLKAKILWHNGLWRTRDLEPPTQ